MMDPLPGEDKMHQILKKANLILMRSKTTFGVQFNVLHHPPKTQVYTKLGSFTIKMTSETDMNQLPGMRLDEVDKVLQTIPDFPPLKR